MRRILIFLIMSALVTLGNPGLVSCKAKRATSPDPAHYSRVSLDWDGVYHGTLPCADCEGIETMIKINPDHTYSIESLYRGKSSQVFSLTGNFEWTSDGNRIILQNSDIDDSPTLYAVGENMLIQRDRKENVISGELADHYILRKDDTGILEKQWNLIELRGISISQLEKTHREVFIILKAINNRAVGNGGCNSFSTVYELPGDNSIQFSSVASTKMACEKGMQIESDFFKLLTETEKFTLRNDTLLLFKGNDAFLKFRHKIPSQ